MKDEHLFNYNNHNHSDPGQYIATIWQYSHKIANLVNFLNWN